jgi:hypothetical protein
MFIVKCEGCYVEVKVFHQSVQLEKKKYHVRSWVTCSSSLFLAIRNFEQNRSRLLEDGRFHAVSTCLKFDLTRQAWNSGSNILKVSVFPWITALKNYARHTREIKSKIATAAFNKKTFFHQPTWHKFKEEASEMLYLEYSFVWSRNFGTS